MIKGFCFISDDRYHRMGQWCKNSFEATNPYKLELVDLEGYKGSDFYRWHQETKNHPLRLENPFGMLKFIAALEIMERQDLDRLIMLGADVFTVGSFQGIENFYCDILHSRNLGSAPNMPNNPDVIVVTKKFLQTAVGLYLQQMEALLLDSTIYVYQEMFIMNHITNQNMVTHMSLAQAFDLSEYCFNMNVRTKVLFNFNDATQKVLYGNLPVVTIHIQTGLYELQDKDAFDRKLFNCLQTELAFSPL